jgi:ribosomal peptide maturation radical SAM protein 1
MTDNIMPYHYFSTLIPKLAKENFGAQIFYEQKSNLTLDKVRALDEAGVRRIQPGIEAVSTSLLRLMKKGVTARQNIALLRYARSVGMKVNWNLLYAFPGDDEQSYHQTLSLLTILRHLEPPAGFFSLSIERFSPYFDKPAEFGISNLHPAESYASVFPEDAPLHQIAYHFEGDYDTAARRNPHLMETLRGEITSWIGAWRDLGSTPTLWVSPLEDDLFLLIDSRWGNGMEKIQFISKSQAAVALREHFEPTQDVQWGMQNGICAIIDGVYVPLAVASAGIISQFERDISEGREIPLEKMFARSDETGLTQIDLSPRF